MDFLLDRAYSQSIAYGCCRRSDVESSHLVAPHRAIDSGLPGPGFAKRVEDLAFDEQKYRSWLPAAWSQPVDGKREMLAIGVRCYAYSSPPPQSTYVISLLIQMRSYIPPSTPVGTDLYSSIGSNGTDPALQPFTSVDLAQKDPSLLATLPDFRVFGRLFDVMFVLAAVGTAVSRYIGHKLNGADEFGTVYH